MTVPTKAEIDAIEAVLYGYGVDNRCLAANCAAAAAEVREGKKRGTRLPEDWEPSAHDLNFARDHNYGWLRPDAELADEIIKFRNYWTSKTGKDATKLNWSRTWQNWILNARRPNGQAALPAPDSLNASKDRWRQAIHELDTRLDEHLDQIRGECSQPDVLLPAPAGSSRPGCVSDSGGHDFFNIPTGGDSRGR